MKRVSVLVFGAVVLLAGGAAIGAKLSPQARKDVLGYQDTPIQTSSKWHVHDGFRPQPKVIDPGTASTNDTPGQPPSDAIVLFDGKDLSKWKSDKGGPAAWKVEDGYMTIDAKAGSLVTRDDIGDCQLHVEWSAPTP